MKKKVFIIAGLLVCIAGIIQLYRSARSNAEPEVTIFHSNGEPYAGSARCVSCHSNIHEQHRNTAHFKTSSVADSTTIKGSFAAGRNVYAFNGRDKMMMEARDSGFFQAGYSNDQFIAAQRFDLVIGSGTKGQSYLHWLGNSLVQLPVSYYTPNDDWSSSPGNPPDRFVINRPVTAPCLNCHSTYFNPTYRLNALPEFDRKAIILGIDCERCHGPGMRHVKNRENGVTAKRDIINPARLTRQQQLDACAQCHSGITTDMKPAFTFLPGDTLSADVTSFQRFDTTATAEVHGNQYGLLTSSQCFRNSEMTCSTCHRPHKNERGITADFASRCISCHQSEHQKKCELTAKLGDAINTRCPDCHMPVRPSNKISFRVAAGEQRAELARTHFIAIYPEQSRKIAETIKALPQP